MPLSEFDAEGYALYPIQLTQPSNATPVGLKLTRQADPLQYIITIVVEKSEAGLAGLQVNDWLVQIEDNDIRLLNFNQVSRYIQQSLTSKGGINLVVARRKSFEPSPIKKVEKAEEKESGVTTEITLDPAQTNTNGDVHTPDFGPVKKDEIRRIVLNEALGLDFNSYLPDDQNQLQVHFISNVQPSSIAERAGLHDGDRILTINGSNTKNCHHEDVRRILLSKKPIELTVVNEPKYIELIASVQHNQKRMSTSLPSDLSVVEQYQKSDVPPDLRKYLHRLFTDDQGTVYFKRCLLKKEPSFDSYGFLLRHSNRLHVIDAVEMDFPAYSCGLREGDVILFVNRENVEQLSHDEVKKRIRHLMKTGEEVDLILMARDDVQRYRDYQQQNSIDWNTILAKDSESETNGSSGKWTETWKVFSIGSSSLFDWLYRRKCTRSVSSFAWTVHIVVVCWHSCVYNRNLS